MNEPDPFEVLGIARSADDAIVRAAHRLRALEVHPDRAGAWSTPRMQAVTAAYALLSDPATRQRWELDHPAAENARPARSPSTGMASRSPWSSSPPSRLARRGWQWLAAVVLSVGLLAAGTIGGAAALGLVALVLGIGWLAERVPDRARFWPLHDLTELARSVVRTGLDLTLTVVAAIARA